MNNRTFAIDYHNAHPRMRKSAPVSTWAPPSPAREKTPEDLERIARADQKRIRKAAKKITNQNDH